MFGTGIYNDLNLWSHFFDGILTGQTYLKFLRTEFEEYYDKLFVISYNRRWFQHDGSVQHYTRAACEYLNGRFGKGR